MTVVALVDDGSIGSLTSLIKSVSDLARNQSREDLVARLEECRQQLASASVRMLVVGDFKQGKSTLVNALINHNVCPTDADFATMVPTIVRHGTEPSATLYNATDGSRAQARSIEVKDVGRWVCEQEGADPERDNVRSCEIRLPIEWMAGGAQLVDMPGYGGLDAVAGTRIVAELRAANAVLFVTDASQELTKPELDLLRMAHQHCPLVVVVVTKIDAHIDWRLIRDINAGHLRRAGLEMPIIAVSALRRIAIDELVGFVQRELLAQAELTRVRHATVEVGSSLAQVRSVVQAELDSFDPVRQVQIAQDLRRTLREITDMRLDSASWHRFLRDKTDDLRTSAIEQLDSGLRELVTEAEIVVGEFVKEP